MKNTVDLYHDELKKRKDKEKKKIEKFKRKEEKKKQKEEKRLEKLEDKEFARRHKMSREAKYNYNKKEKTNFSLLNIYKVSIIGTLLITLCYLLYSLAKQQIHLLNALLFTLIVLGFILTSTIQKKKERKIASIITSILLILWMLLHL